LDLSKVESGKMNLNIFTFHSSELMEDLRQMFESSAKEKNISFFVEDSINSMLVGDRDKISQILRNFLSNAFKFTSEGSVILKAEMDKDRENDVIFSVTDTGIGIPEEHISDIFQEFRQVDGTISESMGDRTWFVHIKETCRPYERRNRSPKQNWRGKYVFLKLPVLFAKKRMAGKR